MTGIFENETRAQWEARERKTAAIIARRIASERRAMARPRCGICGGKMGESRNGLSRCQGDNGVGCGMYAKA